MSDLSPNTEVLLSSDLLDDDLCLENMSALAFAVLDAYMSGYGWLDSPTKKDCRGVAAALRAAVGSDVYKANLNDELEVMFSEGWNSLRKEILAIADELETQ
jgi:hypothetical protein